MEPVCILFSGGIDVSELSRLSDMTLQERLQKADYLNRELSEHLQQAYLPKLAALRSVAKIYDPAEVSDNQILEHTLAVIEAEEFTEELYVKLRKCLDSISKEMGPILFAGSKVESQRRQPDGPVFDLDDMLSD